MFVFAVSVAEVAVKASPDKVDPPRDLPTEVGEQGMTELRSRSAHAEALRRFPWPQRDPFHRLLVSQSPVEQQP